MTISETPLKYNLPLGILIWSKHVYRVIIMRKGLESLKTRLTIVKGCGTDMDVDVRRLQFGEKNR